MWIRGRDVVATRWWCFSCLRSLLLFHTVEAYTLWNARRTAAGRLMQPEKCGGDVGIESELRSLRRCLIIGSPPGKSSPADNSPANIRPARRLPVRNGFLQVNCRPEETFLGEGGDFIPGRRFYFNKERHIKCEIISRRADFSWRRHFSVTPATQCAGLTLRGLQRTHKSAYSEKKLGNIWHTVATQKFRCPWKAC